MTEEKKMRVEFAPGCFDDFEGTQEELDSMIAEIEEAFNSDNAESLLAKSIPLNPDNLSEEQLAKIEKHTEILHVNLDSIEACGGGSARCMMAEVFLPKAE